MKKDKFIQFFINRRKALGYSQNKIANELGISDQAVSNWERGISFPDLSYLDDIAKLLQTNVESLIMGKQKNIKIKSNINFNSERFSLYISKLRKNKQLTQNDLGKILGISGQNISKFEKGGFLPSIDLIEKYAKYFNVSFLNIYYGLDDFELYEDKVNNISKKIFKWIILSSILIFTIVMLFLIPNYMIEKHTVTIILNDDTTLTYQIENEKSIELPELPIKKGYTVKWDNTNTLITEDRTFTAIYTPNKYTITYVYEDNIVESFTEEVIYGQNYFLTIPMVSNYSFSGYTYNGEIIENDIYYYDHDITVYGEFLQEYYTIYREFANTKYIDHVGNGCSFVLSNIGIDKYLSECPFSPNEYDNYKIIAWKDQNGNIYEVGKTYTYNYNKDIVLCPIFAYYGDAFEITVNNEEAKIIKYNISKIIDLIIPDYIVIDNNKYRVTEIAQGTFQDIYFNNITISSNITKIVKNTFSYDDVHGDSPGGNIYYNGTLQEWFNIDFEEYIVSNKAKKSMMLKTSEFLVGESCSNNNILLIPEGVEVIKSYSIANSRVRELIIPNSVHTIEKYAFINSIFESITNIENVENVHENAFN